MAVSFGQDSTWLKVTGGTKAVDMAQVLYALVFAKGRGTGRALVGYGC
jgi:hypothetical protein